MTEVFVANRGKRHGALVRRNYPKSRVRTLSSLLKSNPRKSRKRVHHKLVNSRSSHTGGKLKMAKTRRRRRRANVWFDDKRGHKKAARKGWGRRKAKARRLRRQRLKAAAKAKATKRRKASKRKTRKATRARSNPPRRRRRRRNSWPNNAAGHRKAALLGHRRRKYGKRRAVRRKAKARSRKARRKSRKGTPRGYHRVGDLLVQNPRRRRHIRRRSNPRRHRRVSRRRNPGIGSALAIPRKFPLIGQYFSMPMVKAAGGIGLGMLVGGGFGNMLYSFASSNLSFLADYPKIFKPVCILAAGAGAAVAMNKLGWRNMSKYVILGAGAAVVVDLISPIFSTVMSNIPGLSDYVQLADYVQLQDQAAVERGMLGGYNDYVQLPGVAGLPGFSDQAAVEAGLL